MTERLAQLWRRLFYYLRRDRFDRELQEEMRFHLEPKVQENIEAGMAEQEAQHLAPGVPTGSRDGDSALRHVHDHTDQCMVSRVTSRGGRRRGPY